MGTSVLAALRTRVTGEQEEAGGGSGGDARVADKLETGEKTDPDRWLRAQASRRNKGEDAK